MSYHRRCLVVFTALVLFLLTGARTTQNEEHDNAEIASLFEQDQAARKRFHAFTEDELLAMVESDRKRRQRAYDLYRAGSLRTGPDLYHAAMILQHGESPEDFLLAHELAIASLILGEERAKWLAAASEDRFLKSIGRNQRFGTQFGKDAKPDAKWKLCPVDEQVTDVLRGIMQCPSLEQAKRQEEKLNQGSNG